MSRLSPPLLSDRNNYESISEGTLSLDEMIDLEEGEEDIVDKKGRLLKIIGISRSVVDHELNRKIIDALENFLTEIEWKVIWDHLALGDKTLEEIGKELGLSHERIRQIEKEALVKIRNFIREEDDQKPSATQSEVKKLINEIIMAVKTGQSNRRSLISAFNDRYSKDRKLRSSDRGSIFLSPIANNLITIKTSEQNTDFILKMEEHKTLGLIIYFEAEDGDKLGVVINVKEIEERKQRKHISIYSAIGENHVKIRWQLKEDLVRDAVSKVAKAVGDQKENRGSLISEFNGRDRNDRTLKSSSSGHIVLTLQKHNQVVIYDFKKSIYYALEMEEDKTLGLVNYFRPKNGDERGVVINIDELEEINEEKNRKRISYYSASGNTHEEIKRQLKEKLIKDAVAEVLLAVRDQKKNRGGIIQKFQNQDPIDKVLRSSAGGGISLHPLENNDVSIESFGSEIDYEIDFEEHETFGLIIYFETEDGYKRGVVINIKEIKERIERRLFPYYSAVGENREEIKRQFKEQLIKEAVVEVLLAVRDPKNNRGDIIEKFQNRDPIDKVLRSNVGGGISLYPLTNNNVSIESFGSEIDYAIDFEEDKTLGLIIYFKTKDGVERGAVIRLDQIKTTDERIYINYFAAWGLNHNEIKIELQFKQSGQLIRAREKMFQPADWLISEIEGGPNTIDSVFHSEIRAALKDNFPPHQLELIMFVAEEMVGNDLSLEEVIKQDEDIREEDKIWLRDVWAKVLPSLLEKFGKSIMDDSKRDRKDKGKGELTDSPLVKKPAGRDSVKTGDQKLIIPPTYSALRDYVFWLRRKDGNYTRGIKAIKDFLNKNPKKHNAWGFYIKVLRRANRLDEALKEVERVLVDFTGYHSGFYVTKASILGDLGKVEEGIALLEKEEVWLSKTNYYLFTLAKLYILNDMSQMAIKILDIDKHPWLKNKVGSYIWLAKAYWASNEIIMADDTLNTAKQIFKNDPDVLTRIGRLEQEFFRFY